MNYFIKAGKRNRWCFNYVASPYEVCNLTTWIDLAKKRKGINVKRIYILILFNGNKNLCHFIFSSIWFVYSYLMKGKQTHIIQQHKKKEENPKRPYEERQHL